MKRQPRYIDELKRLFKGFDAADLRWSYVIICALIPVGVIINIFFAHGWSVWPFVAVIGFLVVINELVDRGGEGFPPLQVYAFFIGVLLVYALALAIISALNIFVLFAGMMVIFYYSGKAYVEKREREKLIAQREADGQCVFCGETLAAEEAYCQSCGNEPAASARVRISAVMKNNASAARMRAALGKKSGSAAARAKEQALVARSFNRQRSSRKKS